MLSESAGPVAGVSRRGFVRTGALASGAFFINTRFSRAILAGGSPPSPPTTPFVEPLAFSRYAIPRPSFEPLDPAPIPEAHQRWDEFVPRYYYEMPIREVLGRPHPQLGLSRMSSYGGSVPGPTFMARYGEPILVRFRNELPEIIQGFGSSEIITHLHNGNQASESDGFPAEFYGPGYFKDHHYPNYPAGGSAIEAKGTLWYHDHCMDFTAQNTYRGLAGFYLLFDSFDSGNERDANPDAFRLPSGVPDGTRVRNRFDIPLVLADRQFDADGVLFMDPMDMDGYIGDKFLVNGRVQPYFEVERRKYRFRVLAAGPSRYWDLWFSNGMEFTLIGTDGNLLPTPIEAQNFTLGQGERMDIVVDFSTLPETTREVYLVNRAEQRDGRGPERDRLPMAQSPRILKLVVRSGEVADPSRIPAFMRPLGPVETAGATRREWKFDRRNGMWTVNNEFFDPVVARATVVQGRPEIWHFSTTGGWAHPIHFHLEEGRVLSYNRKPVAGTVLGGRKDVFTLYDGDEFEVFARFRDFTGRYVMHCHNTVHEDHAMMIRFDVVRPS
jgi:FtsP/CotA-like multicopper oxidase with cupredoxin domain